MQVTSFTDYAFRVLMALAVSDKEKESTSDMAEKLGVSKNHLIKVVQELNRVGVIESSRGVSGGVALKRPPHEISILEVFDRLEGEGNLLECFNLGSNTCPLQPVCKLSGIFKEAIDAYRKVLEKYTLEDLLVRKEELSFYLV